MWYLKYNSKHVYLWFFVPLENFSLIWRRHHCRWRAENFDLCSATKPLSSECSLTCHIYCDTGHPFIIVISEDRRGLFNFSQFMVMGPCRINIFKPHYVADATNSIDTYFCQHCRLLFTHVEISDFFLISSCV